MDIEKEIEMLLLNQMNAALLKLKSYIEQELHSSLSSYTPSVYKRTGATMASVYISKSPKMVNGEISAEIGFLDFLANHDSVMGENQPQGSTPWLLEVGWDISKKTGRTRPFFDIHPDYRYIKKAVDRFNSESAMYGGIQVNVYVDGNIYI